MSYADPQAHTMAVLDQVLDERARQDAKWGEQNHPDGTGDWDSVAKRRDIDLHVLRREDARAAQARCDRAAKEGRITYRHILDEEVREAFAEDEPARLRSELVQVAAVAVKWIEAIDRRKA